MLLPQQRPLPDASVIQEHMYLDEPYNFEIINFLEKYPLSKQLKVLISTRNANIGCEIP